MKKLFLLLTFYAQLFNLIGQAPQSFNYQAVIRDSSNSIISNQSIGVQIAILQGNANGNSVYTETFSETTNDYGLIHLDSQFMKIQIPTFTNAILIFHMQVSSTLQKLYL